MRGAVTPSPTGKPRVLVAEDDAPLREIVEEGLRSEGFEVVTADDGGVALEIFRRSGPYDVLLLDEEMPRMRGRELLARLRADGERVPAVLISGNLELGDEQRRELDVGPVLRKPISIEDLARALRKVIESGPGS